MSDAAPNIIVFKPEPEPKGVMAKVEADHIAAARAELHRCVDDLTDAEVLEYVAEIWYE